MSLHFEIDGRASRTLKAKLRVKIERVIFGAWQKHTDRKLYNKYCVARMRERWMKNILPVIYQKWYTLAHRKAILKMKSNVLKRRINKTSLTKSWNQMRSVYILQQREVSAEWKANRHFRIRTTSRAFSAWKRTVELYQVFAQREHDLHKKLIFMRIEYAMQRFLDRAGRKVVASKQTSYVKALCNRWRLKKSFDWLRSYRQRAQQERK